MKSKDIVIAGAGPAGLTVALALAQMNKDITIYEQGGANKQLSRATGIQRETLNILDELGVGSTIRSLSVPIWGSYIYYNLKPVYYIEFCNPSQPPENISINQLDLEKILIENLTNKQKIDINWFYQVSLINDSLHIQNTVNDYHFTTPSNIIIACDGRKSILRDQSNIQWTGVKDSDLSYSFDCSLENQLEHEIMHQMIFDYGRIVFVPLPIAGNFRVTGTYLPYKDEKSSPETNTIISLIEEKTNFCPKNVRDLQIYRLGMYRA